MNAIETVEISCPNCAENIDVVIDTSTGNHEYFEDCEVCCKPMKLLITLDENRIPNVEPRQEDEL